MVSAIREEPPSWRALKPSGCQTRLVVGFSSLDGTTAGALIRVVATGQLGEERLREIRALMAAAFGERFDAEDWDHALGGVHVMATDGPDGALVGHAAVVERTLQAGMRQLRTGYVEAVATAPARQRQGIGRLVMTGVRRILEERYEMGALATGVHAFYRRLGWEDWLGPTAVREGAGLRYTPEEDGFVMVMRFGRSEGLALDMTLSVTPRSGDDW